MEILDTLALRGRRTRVFVALLLLLCPSTARAWKITTHMILAERAAASLDDPDLRQTLIANVDYLRGGAVGPDLFYAPNFRIQQFHRRALDRHRGAGSKEPEQAEHHQG